MKYLRVYLLRSLVDARLSRYGAILDATVTLVGVEWVICTPDTRKGFGERLAPERAGRMVLGRAGRQAQWPA